LFNFLRYLEILAECVSPIAQTGLRLSIIMRPEIAMIIIIEERTMFFLTFWLILLILSIIRFLSRAF